MLRAANGLRGFPLVAAWVALLGCLTLPLVPMTGLTGLAARVTPVLGFLAAVTLVSSLAESAGLFEAAVDAAARLARGRTWALAGLLLAVGTLATWTLSLDATAVLLTPVALLMSRRLGLPTLPFALACAWTANTASLLLPAANLTNLLALHTLGLDAAGYVARAAGPQAVMLAVLVLWWAARFGTSLPTRFDPPAPAATDPRLVAVAGLTAAGLAVAIVTGVAPWLAATGAAAALVVGHATLGDRTRVRPTRLAADLPWDMLAFACGLFLLMDAAGPLLHRALAPAAGTGSDAPGLLRLALVSAGAANLADNLPAYLALEPLAGGVERTFALLIGVGAGPSVLLWGSLANLLWWQRCRAHGVQISPRRFALEGLPVAVLTVVAGTLAL